MANYTIQEMYLQVDRWLGEPFSQCPSPDMRLEQIYVEINAMLMKLANTGETWANKTVSLQSAVGQTNYTLSLNILATNDLSNIGKLYSAVKKTDNKYQPFVDVPVSDLYSRKAGEPLPYHNDSSSSNITLIGVDALNGTLQVQIHPTPTKIEDYTLYFNVGALDKFNSNWTDVFVVKELCDFIALQASAALLPYSEWYEDMKENLVKQQRIEQGLEKQIARKQIEVDNYIERKDSNKGFDVGYWNQR
jgi:hypothetical protein